MSKKAYSKKKAYQARVREQAKQGLVNKPSGDWERGSVQSAMHRDQQAGYRFNR